LAKRPKSRIDKLIDQAEQTNAQIRALTEALLLSNSFAQTIPMPIPQKLALRAVPTIQEKQSELYFDTIRGAADLVQNPAARQLVTDVGRGAFEATNLLPMGPDIIEPVTKTRTPAQKRNDKMQSEAFKRANTAMRTKSGVLRKGRTQADVAKRAQLLLRRMKKGKKGTRKSSGKSPRSGGGRKR